MENHSNTRLSQFIRIVKEDNTSYIFKFPENNGKGQLKNNGTGTLDFEIAGSGVYHIASDEKLSTTMAGCCITVGANSPIVVTLPTVASAEGQLFNFIRTQDVSSTVTIQSQNSETLSIVDYVNGAISGTSINSNNSQPIGSSIQLYSTGSEWVGCHLSNGWSV